MTSTHSDGGLQHECSAAGRPSHMGAETGPSCRPPHLLGSAETSIERRSAVQPDSERGKPLPQDGGHAERLQRPLPPPVDRWPGPGVGDARPAPPLCDRARLGRAAKVSSPPAAGALAAALPPPGQLTASAVAGLAATHSDRHTMLPLGHGCCRRCLPTRVWACAAPAAQPADLLPLRRIGSSARCHGLTCASFASPLAPRREAFQSYIAEDAFFLKSFGECCRGGGRQPAHGQRRGKPGRRLAGRLAGRLMHVHPLGVKAACQSMLCLSIQGGVRSLSRRNCHREACPAAATLHSLPPLFAASMPLMSLLRW